MKNLSKVLLSASALLGAVLLLLRSLVPELVVGKNAGFFLNSLLSLALCLLAAEQTDLQYRAASVGRIVMIASWAILVTLIDALVQLHYFPELQHPSLRAGLLTLGILMLLYWIRRFKRSRPIGKPR